MQRFLGIAPLSFIELSPPDMVACAAEAGFDGLGLRLIPATPTERRHDSIGNTALVRETVRRLRETGLRVSDVELFRLQPQTCVADFSAALETGALLGARQATVSCQIAAFGQLVDCFGAFCELAAGFGITANIEPTPWVEVRTVAMADRLIVAAGVDAGIVVDPLHFDRAADELAQLARLPASRFNFMQLCDAPAARPADLDTMLFQARAERLMPGDGGLDLKALLATVPADTPISLEVPMHALAATTPASVRARRMLQKTRALLDAIASDEPLQPRQET